MISIDDFKDRVIAVSLNYKSVKDFAKKIGITYQKATALMSDKKVKLKPSVRRKINQKYLYFKRNYAFQILSETTKGETIPSKLFDLGLLDQKLEEETDKINAQYDIGDIVRIKFRRLRFSR